MVSEPATDGREMLGIFTYNDLISTYGKGNNKLKQLTVKVKVKLRQLEVEVHLS